MPRFLLLPLAILAATVLAACTAAKEDATPTPSAGSPAATPATPTPTEPPGGAGGGGLEGTVVPITTPFPTPPPVPADWATYSQPASEKSSAFELSHPADWVVQEGDPTGPGVGLSIVMWSWQEGQPPGDSIKLDLTVVPLKTGYTGCEPPGDAPASLGGLTGWQTVEAYDPAKSNGLTQSHWVAADRDGLRYCLAGLFIQGIDETTFLQILESFRFID
jgi:hypothetical protein